MLYQFCKYALSLEGDFAECGTYTGGTAYLLASILKKTITNKQLHLFDTFQGMPDIAIPERDSHSPGDFGDTSLEYVQTRLQEFPFVKLHPGVIPDTFQEIKDIDSFAFVHIDVDIYPTALECCKWFWPRLVKGGIMIFDDYGFWSYRSAIKAAVDEYFANRAEKPIILPTAQAVAIKGKSI